MLGLCDLVLFECDQMFVIEILSHLLVTQREIVVEMAPGTLFCKSGNIRKGCYTAVCHALPCVALFIRAHSYGFTDDIALEHFLLSVPKN